LWLHKKIKLKNHSLFAVPTLHTVPCCPVSGNLSSQRLGSRIDLILYPGVINKTGAWASSGSHGTPCSPRTPENSFFHAIPSYPFPLRAQCYKAVVSVVVVVDRLVLTLLAFLPLHSPPTLASPPFLLHIVTGSKNFSSPCQPALPSPLIYHQSVSHVPNPQRIRPRGQHLLSRRPVVPS